MLSGSFASGSNARMTSAITCLDGYQLTKKGRAGAALTIVVSEFATVSQFAAYVKRLATFTEALDPNPCKGDGKSGGSNSNGSNDSVKS